MADGVLKKVAASCRRAMKAGTPILYIKTDSSIFIRKLILMEEKPLVVLVSAGGKIIDDTKIGRPIYELEDPLDRTLQFVANYANDLPSDGAYEKQCKFGPAIWVRKMPDKPESATGAMAQLEKFALAQEDPSHRQYDQLQSSVVVLYSLNPWVPPMLQAYTEFIDVPYPDEEEIRQIVKSASAGWLSKAGEETLSSLCTYFLGFSEEEIVTTVQQIMSAGSLANRDEENERALQKTMEDTIRLRKRQKMEGGILEYVQVKEKIGGMERYKSWLKDQVAPLKYSNAYRRSIGTNPPKGVLLCGIPGCGKSAAAKFTAEELGLELLRMDVGSLMDRYQGVSEQRMRDALKMAETVSPCVLWIDELEKGFSGAAGDGDNGSFKRMFGYMLGWMQENTTPCFIFATANDIGSLPKEFFRSGRFDALFAVYLPTARECANIIKVHMDKRRREAAKARGVDPAEVVLFDRGCDDESFLLRFINESLASDPHRPRIVVGSDLEAIVSQALRSLQSGTQAPISPGKWRAAMDGVLRKNTFATYGQGEENIDAIAVSYCRMLRKGFVPTTEDELFRSADYHMENLERYKAFMRKDASSMSKEELEKELREAEIMADSGRSFGNSYDRAVYRFLRGRINRVAVRVEEYEREKIYRG